MKVERIDHLVLTVHNIDETVTFYTRVLGMTPTVFGKGRVALTFGNQKINLHLVDHEFEPKAGNPFPGSADLCFITRTPIDRAISHVKKCGVKIIEGPVRRTGAKGKILSFYFRDPHGNLIEIANEILEKS
jgi:catechol 2,3-dioxygenase-like lactoylglutathione lyase family enzyme